MGRQELLGIPAVHTRGAGSDVVAVFSFFSPLGRGREACVEGS